KRQKEQGQMTGARRAGRPMAGPKAPGAASHGRAGWSQIDWNRAEKNVRRLEARIVKAAGGGRWGKVRSLQHLLTHSYSGKVLAVKRVTTTRGKSCFDQISHSWLLDHVPMDKKVLLEWLKAGFMDKSVLHPTDEGTPQGGIASPVLANLALDGLDGML